MALTLRWKDATTLPVEAEGLRPESLRTLDAAEVARLPLRVGNATAALGDLFDATGDPADGELRLEGDMRPVRALGSGMTEGTIAVRGAIGRHLGAGMSGGTIDVEGAAGDWAGSEMRGGTIRIRGGAGDSLGAAYPGSRLGMRDGVILVEGAIGRDAALGMRRGLIAIAGDAGEGLGRRMVAGSVFLFGRMGRGAGAGMKRGTIAAFGPGPTELLPTFRPSCRFRPPFATIYLKALRSRGFPVPPEVFAGAFEKYNGDLIEGGLGEVLLWEPGRGGSIPSTGPLR